MAEQLRIRRKSYEEGYEELSVVCINMATSISGFYELVHVCIVGPV